MGVILVAPLLLTYLATPLRTTLIAKRSREAVVLLGGYTAITMLAVQTESPAGFLVIPLGLWIAMRLEQPGAAAAVVIMTAIDVWHAVAVETTPGELMSLQGVNATIAMIFLACAAIVHERRHALEELGAAAQELEARVASRTTALVQANERLESEIVERRATESALRASEERLEQAQRLAHIGSFEWDAITDRNSWSDELFLIYGLDPAGDPPSFEEYMSFVRPEKRDEVRAAVARAMETGEPLNHEYPVTLRDGRKKWVHAYIEILRDRDGTVLGLRGTCQDVTERRRAEEAVRWSEERFRTLLESAPDAVVVVDPQGTIVLMNEQTTQIFGYERDELMGANVDILLPNDARAEHGRHRWRYAAQPARRPMGAGKNLYAVKKDGSQIPVDISLSPVETDTGFLVFALVRDASDRRAVEETLRTSLEREREAAEHLRKLDQAKNVFLSAVSHELRTPLTAILGFAELLQDDELRGSADMTNDLVDRLKASANRLAELLADLLDIDRLNRGILEPRRRATSLHNLIERALLTLEVNSHPLQLEVENAVVQVDPAQTERIVENLISNAVKYTPDGTQIILRAAPTAGAGVNIVVEDKGPGISEEIRRSIFEPFVRGENDGTFTQGTGIGLALVDRFARLHGGRAWVTEAAGGGASFHVVLGGPNEQLDDPPERSAVA